MFHALACCLLPFALVRAVEGPAMLTVSGERLVVNGHDQVPAGLFGVHHMPLDQRVEDWGIEHARFIHQVPGAKPMVPGVDQRVPAGVLAVECFFDRYIPAKQLTNPDGWEAELRELGRRYGEATRDTGLQHYVEFWNEPFLNWGNKPGVNYDPTWYDLERAVEGGPVHIKGRDEPVAHLRWKRDKWWRVTAGDDDFGKYVQLGNLWHRYSKQRPGESHTHQGRTLECYATLRPHDPGQPSWWSGPQNRLWYSQMLRAFGEGLKQANPEVQLAAGWGFHMSTAGWQAWELLGQPTIDDGIDLIDAWHEHHYGGDPRSAAAQFLMIDSYARRVHGKALKWWNTEAGGNYDPQRPDRYKSGTEHWYERRYPDDVERREAHLDCAFLLRDVLHAIRVCPDKAVFRADHHPHHNQGSPLAFRLLKDLRGELVATTSPDAELWCVASRPADGRLTVVAWNDGVEARRVPLRVAAPPGGSLSGCTVLRLEDGETGAPSIIEQTLGLEPGAVHEHELALPPRQAVVLRYAVDGAGTAGALHVSEFLADAELRTIGPDEPLQCRVRIPAEAVAAADGARLRLTRAGDDLAQATVELGGRTIALPAASYTQYVDLDPAWLSPETELRFATTGAAHTFYAAAIELLERRTAD